jgi:hypothetical protein
LDDSWEDVTPDEQRENTPNRRFKHKGTEEEIEFHPGRRNPDGSPGPGKGGRDHWHRYNPLRKHNKRDLYLDRNGNPVARDSKPSHIYPRSQMGLIEGLVDRVKAWFESGPEPPPQRYPLFRDLEII